MTVEFGVAPGHAAARVLAPNAHRSRRQDTRLSAIWFRGRHSKQGACGGVDAHLNRPAADAGIAYLTHHFGCRFGVVITPRTISTKKRDQVLRSAGQQAVRQVEEQIEQLLDEPALTRESISLGRAPRVDKSRGIYQDFCCFDDA